MWTNAPCRSLPRAIFATLLVGATPGVRAGDVRSVDECVRMALHDNHPLLAVATADVAAADAGVGKATGSLFPTVQGDYLFSRRDLSLQALIEGPETPLTEQSELFNFQRGAFTLEQLLFDFGRVLNTRRAAVALRDAAQLDKHRTRQRIAFEVRRTYFELIAAKRLLHVAEESEGNTLRQQREAEKRYSAGLSPNFDVKRQDVAVANAELTTLTATHNARLARENLQVAIGLEQPLVFEPDDAALTTPIVPVEEGDALERAYAQRPDLRSLRESEHAQRQRVTALTKQYLPTVTGGAAYQWTGEDSLDEPGWIVGAQASLLIFNGGIREAEVGEARALLEELEARERQLRLQIGLETQAALLGLRRAMGSVSVTHQAEEAATDALRIAEKRYDAGVANIDELASAQLLLTTAQATRVRVASDYHIARAQYDYAVGQRVGVPKRAPDQSP